MQNKLYVGNLPFSATETEIEAAFSAFGSVQSINLVTDRDTGRPRGFGFVEMGSDSEAQAAIAGLDQQELGGRRLTVNVAKPREPRGGGGGGGGAQQNQGGAQAATESRIKGSPADGEADRKDLTEKGNWGMLDKQAEAKTRELIRQKFPSNFLDQIGLYTRKLAEKKK